MSLDQLVTWLMDEGVKDDVETLTRLAVRTELDHLAPETVETAPIDWHRLLFAGSILARSAFRQHQEAALRIATGAVTMADTQPVKDAGAVLLGKLTNFRAVDLANDRKLLETDLEGRLGFGLRMETQRRKLDHSVLIESSGHWLQVNDFQQRFWDSATLNNWLSASAPTASGKTFLVLQWLINHMRSAETRVSVYLAPTRALVSEIETNLAQLLGKAAEIEVSSLPLPEKYDAAQLGGKKLILVFTQERLHLLANVLGKDVHVDLLIVDEAHKIGDNQRGVILQDAIERLERSNDDLKVVFISPATQNPEELLADAPGVAKTDAVDSDAPTVIQNLIVAEQVPRKPKLWNLSIREGTASQSVGVLKLASSPSNATKKLAFIAAAVGERGGTLVYANRAGDAEDIADLIAQLVPAIDGTDKELIELADLARKGVHPNFALASLVLKGVAFHYGNMPSLIRQEVERLFKSGKIRFLVCTSTLIEGVNLSCRTIVVRGPRKGMGNPMEPHDFWNLAGRAGRWGNEFQGNIVCIDPDDTTAWPNGVPIRSRYPIKRESDAVLETGDGMADYLERRADTPLFELADVGRFEPVGAYLLSTYLRLGSIAQASFAKRHSPNTIAKIDEKLAALADKIEIGSGFSERHPGVSALGLQSLLEAFRAYEKDVENLIPAPVESQDSYDRFVTIMRRINEHLYPAFMPDSLIPLYVVIVVQWLKGFSLAAMIRANIDYHNRHGRKFVLPKLIRQTMEHVEQVARFKAPKYLSAYMDILHLYFREIDREDLIDTDLDIGTQLEFGVSTRTLLSLMEMGLSRMSAVSLYEKIARDNLTKEECMTWIRQRDDQFDTMDIPAIIVREIREKILAIDQGSPDTVSP
ncbi:DEAD/DEAH box helicase [Gluconobacter kondonii]|uniref:DEAD/DEAH box helicase n=1 Tax=Gluconobacter kondonii TaxID=941463 RepID=UPI0020A0EAF9|nr:DEAD/DEAH box helicase [Gluconobacter kondonii]MCP1237625.1 DEAD/DEAH box helicase [Gluconobacter kondonii]